MARQNSSGAEFVATRLRSFGVDCVFGVPGSQNVALFDALNQFGIRTVLASSEAAAGFMANGWYRASGRVGVFAAISGPGFAFSVPALAEAALDSSAVLLIVGCTPNRGRAYDLQWLDQDTIANVLCHEVHTARTADQVDANISKALVASMRDGPATVVFQHSKKALEETGTRAISEPDNWIDGTGEIQLPDDFVESILECRKPLLIVGANALDYSNELASLANQIGAAITTTPTARGIIAEYNDRVIPADLLCDDVEELNRFIEQCDLVIAVGCRFSHNGTGGFSAKIPKDRLAHAYPNAAVLNANYDARWAIQASSESFIKSLASIMSTRRKVHEHEWSSDDLHVWRDRILRRNSDTRTEPEWPELEMSGCRPVIQAIREALPDNAILVTDTGNHQIYARKYYEVRTPRGLIFPTDFQSMGFGLPAAIGAALANPERPTVALLGDGAFMMASAELATVVRENIPLVIILISDGWLGQIRNQQIKSGVPESMTKLLLPDTEMFINSMGMKYVAGGADIVRQIQGCWDEKVPSVIELKASESTAFKRARAYSRTKRSIKNVAGPFGINTIKRVFGKRT